MSDHPFKQSFEQLPEVLPIFPLSGAIVLPSGSLPLNIFEPRYLNMVQDAMRTNQLIGMIQPKDSTTQAALYDVGCAGRIRRYEEVEGGRLEIIIEGLCRFKIQEELNNIRGYRMVKADWRAFENDFRTSSSPSGFNHQSLIRVLRRYFEVNKLDTDWELIKQVNQVELVNNLCGYLPLSTEDKQLLIEAMDANERVRSFIAILDREQDEGNTTRH